MNKDRALGCFMGLAIGDALGVPLEFKDRDVMPPVTDMIGGGLFKLNPGEWTDDTSMALALADSILEYRTINKEDIMQKFIQWYKKGSYSHNGKCFDIGSTTSKALSAYYSTKSYSDAPDNHFNSGNGSIMRLAPVPVYYYNDIDTAILKAKDQSMVTHGSKQVLSCVEELTIMLVSLINGISKDEVVDSSWTTVHRDTVKSSGFALDTLNAAKWAFANTNSFKDALILAVNLADDADTVGAVTGQIAGAYYGLSSIPLEWINKLVWKDHLYSIAMRLYNRN